MCEHACVSTRARGYVRLRIGLKRTCNSCMRVSVHVCVLGAVAQVPAQGRSVQTC